MKLFFALMTVALSVGCAKLSDDKIDASASEANPSIEGSSVSLSEDELKLSGYWVIDGVSETSVKAPIPRRLMFTSIVFADGPVSRVMAGCTSDGPSVSKFTLHAKKLKSAVFRKSRKTSTALITELSGSKLVLDGRFHYRRFQVTEQPKIPGQIVANFCSYKVN